MYKTKFTLIALASSLLLALAIPLHATESEEALVIEILAQAEFDECVFYDPTVTDSHDRVPTVEETAAGLNPNEYSKSGLTAQQVEDCYAGQGDFNKPGLVGLAKRNQAYVWGLKKKENKLWWGTGPNVDKLVGGSYFGSTDGEINGEASNIGEFNASKFAAFGVIDEENNIDYDYKVSGSFGDFRPPNMYCYDLDSDLLTRLDLDLAPEDAELLWKTLGLRSVGYTAPIFGYPEGIVFIAGPSVAYNERATTDSQPEVLGINMFAFNAATGECIGSQSFPAHSNIRKWLEHDGQLYATVANQDATGSVLKHNSNPLAPGFPFNFDVVGNLASGGAEIEFFEDRIFVNTWPGVEGEYTDLGPEDIQLILGVVNGPASLYRSPIVPPGGLLPVQANSWTRVWSSVDYDPDFAISLHYGGGAMEVFDDGEEQYLYWGTTHVVNTAQAASAIIYGMGTAPVAEDFDTVEAFEAAQDEYEILQDKNFVYPLRFISLWRGKDFTTSSGDIDLLYGSEFMQSRMDSSIFRRFGDPRQNFSIFRYGLFLLNNLGKMGEIEDGEEVVLLSIPLPFGRSYDFTTTFEDGGDWDLVPTGWTPLYGKEGVASASLPANFLGDYDASLGLINVSGNFYTWSMQALNNKLYFGTLDIIGDQLGPLLPGSKNGADIFCFPDHNSPAELISSDAFGNPYAYGIRNMQADEARGELYAGTANAQNLRNEGSEAKLANQPNNQDADLEANDETVDEGDGGWELLRVTFGEPVAESLELAAKSAPSTAGDPEVLANSVEASDEWLIDNSDTTSATVSFTSVGADASGLKTLEWPSYPGKFYTVYVAAEAESKWSPVQTYSGTGGTLRFEWDASNSDFRYVKVIESSEAPIASL